MLGRIGIHLSSDTTCARRIDAALKLARQHNSEVVGILPVSASTARYYEEGIIPQDVRAKLRSSYDEAREHIRRQFLDAAAAAGVKAEWRMPQGEPDETLAVHARYCDVLIMSKAERAMSASSIIPNLPESVVMAAGRPVIMLPNYGEFETIGRRVLYCWDQRREAARAFSDASPFLRNCQELAVLEVDRDDEMMRERDIHESDFDRYCASLGYPKPKRLVKSSKDYGVGNVILNAASDMGSDLIVMGAYGHSRMRQWVMGGASRTLLEAMTVPVLLAH